MISRGAQPLPFKLRMSAPICPRGSIMRPMGRLWMEASPSKTVTKGWAARIPEISRVVVPLLPTFSQESGDLSP